MRWIRADLHIHSALSPCGSLAMSPRRIVEAARQARLDLIAVCDHNTGEAGKYVRQVAPGHGDPNRGRGGDPCHLPHRGGLPFPPGGALRFASAHPQ